MRSDAGEDLLGFRAEFNRSVRIESRPERLTAEGVGAIALRDVMERLGFIPWLTERLDDPRDPDLITHSLPELLRTSLLLMAQGWRDQDDADALRDDAAMRIAASDRRAVSSLEMRPRIPGEELSHNPPKRRRFIASEKLRILRAADAAIAGDKRGALEALLRREAIYSSHLSYWRQQMTARETDGLSPKKPGRKPKLDDKGRRLLALTEQNAKLERKLRIADALIALQKKAHEIMGIALPEHDEER